jgi:peptide/nickel transport system ATP-binding protein/oligopeptide transport system ATP-binding protein
VTTEPVSEPVNEPATEPTPRSEAAPRGAAALVDAKPILSVEDLKMYFPVKSSGFLRRTIGHVQAVDGVSFQVKAGTSLGLVGESGCGKSTTGRLITRLYKPTAGRIDFDGHDIANLSEKELHPLRRDVQMIFQDPYTSLNPRHTVGSIIGAPLAIHKVVPKDKILSRVQELLEIVGLNPEHYNRYPHEFSGGQRQRIGIARALTLQPKLLVADEPVSALDVSIQAQVINLLDELQDEFHLSYIFVAHDLSVVRHVSDRIVVMYLGKVMEVSPSEELYTKPIHPYTSALLSAIPIPDPNENRARTREVVGGEPPNPISPPSGCRFHTRCPRATDICRRVEPQLTEYAGGHLAACHHPQNVTADEIAAATRSPASPLSSGTEPPEAEERGVVERPTTVSEPAPAPPASAEQPGPS